MADIVNMPKLGFDMSEGTLVRWVVSEGEGIQKGKVLAEIETDKATVEVESPFNGVLRRQIVAAGEVVPVGQPIAVIAAPDEALPEDLLSKFQTPEITKPQPPGEITPPTHEGVGTIPLIISPITTPKSIESTMAVSIPWGFPVSPVARRMAVERGIDLQKVQGSGPGGRIVKADIEKYREIPLEETEISVTERLPVAGEARLEKRMPLSRLRSAIRRRMTQAKQQVPHFYLSHEYDMGELMSLRQKINSYLSDEEKISVNDFIIKAVALTLLEFPNLNASLDEDKNEVIQFGRINIGVAVAVPNGLLTVVCRDTDQKPLRQIATEIRNMVQRVRDGKVRPDDIEGSTFSVSNLGMYNVNQFIAILNPPEAAILAIGAVQEVPVVEHGEIKPGLRMTATISVDHRVSDGAEAARFLQVLARYLEEPMRLLL